MIEEITAVRWVKPSCKVLRIEYDAEHPTHKFRVVESSVFGGNVCHGAYQKLGTALRMIQNLGGKLL